MTHDAGSIKTCSGRGDKSYKFRTVLLQAFEGVHFPPRTSIAHYRGCPDVTQEGRRQDPQYPSCPMDHSSRPGEGRRQDPPVSFPPHGPHLQPGEARRQNPHIPPASQTTPVLMPPLPVSAPDVSACMGEGDSLPDPCPHPSLSSTRRQGHGHPRGHSAQLPGGHDPTLLTLHMRGLPL